MKMIPCYFVTGFLSLTRRLAARDFHGFQHTSKYHAMTISYRIFIRTLGSYKREDRPLAWYYTVHAQHNIRMHTIWREDKAEQ